jgi:hypothetical protein
MKEPLNQVLEVGLLDLGGEGMYPQFMPCRPCWTTEESLCSHIRILRDIRVRAITLGPAMSSPPSLPLSYALCASRGGLVP